MHVCRRNVTLDIDAFKVAAKAMPQLAAVTLIESLFTSFTSFSLRDDFLAKLATDASQQQHEVSARVLDIIKRITEEQGSRINNHHKTLPEDGAHFLFPKYLLFHLVDLVSMAAIASPESILQKWTAFEYKRKWVMDASKSSTLLSLASLELEFDERIGKPQRSVWDILLECVVTLITLSPDSISQLQNINHPDEVLVEAAAGPKALALLLVVGALPRETVLFLSTKASWTFLLSQMRMGLEDGFRQLLLGDRKPMSSDLSVIRAEMDSYLLQLQDIVR